MNRPDADRLWSERSLRYLSAVLAVWTLLIGILLLWSIRQGRARAEDLARNAARISFEKDLLARRWVAEQGGVYVPVSDRSPPNPYLSMVPERDVRTPSGGLLTLVNPATMTRQIHEMAAVETGVRGHITSLRPLRPENAPDPWETQALRKLEQGEPEVSEVVGSGDGAVLRLIRPLRTEESCLKCHHQNGNRVGDVRGGISVSVPMAPYEAAMRSAMLGEGAAFGLIWLAGAGAFVFGGRKVQQELRERRRTAVRLLEKEHFLEETQRVAHLGVYELDAAAGKWTCSGMLEEIFGIGDDYPKDVEGWLAIVHPDQREEMRRYLDEHVLSGRNPFAKEYRIVRRNDRKERWVFGLGELKFDAEGNPVRMIGTIQDVSERHHLEEKLRQGQRMEAVGQLAGGVAHDFNNMLQAINGYLELALQGLSPEVPEREHLLVAARAGERATNLVRQLLAFGRRQILRPEQLDLNEIVHSLLSMLRRTISANIQIDFLQGHKIGSVFADRVQMEQVLMNLCINARDAMPDGGSLTIETENVLINSEYRRTHPWARMGRYVLVSVTDTGCGMDPETLERIWEPFFTTKGIGEGTGLGLSTVHGIVAQHGGMIHAYSEPGKGSTFKIYMPIVERAAVSVGTKVDGPVVGGTETILVAEDDDMVREFASRVLCDAGYTVVTAKDGEEAVRVCEELEGAVDLVLLDVVMPRLGGRAVYERLKGPYPGLKFLFTSGYSPNAVHTDFVLNEGFELLEKPFDAKRILLRIRKILDQS